MENFVMEGFGITPLIVFLVIAAVALIAICLKSVFLVQQAEALIVERLEDDLDLLLK